MDEVIADTLGEHLRRFNEAALEEISIRDLWGKGLWDIVSTEHQELLRELLHAEDFFEDLPVMPDAPEVLHDLAGRFEVFIATQAMSVPNSFGPKYRWLQRHFPFLPPTQFVYCGDKSILRADYLIDDLPRNLKRFTGTGLLYSAPHNQGATGFTRVANWQEVAAYFETV
jgi:5'(3')-deoxyribonucleotidase